MWPKLHDEYTRHQWLKGLSQAELEKGKDARAFVNGWCTFEFTAIEMN